jgi:hypothetical protein
VSAVDDAAQSREVARGELQRLKAQNEEEARRLEEVKYDINIITFSYYFATKNLS